MQTEAAVSSPLPSANALGTIFGRIVRPLWPLAAITCSILVVRDLAEVASVYLLSPVVTSVSEGLKPGVGREAQMHEIASAVGILLLAQLGFNALISLSYIWNAKLSTRLMASMRSGVYDHLQRLSFSFYDANSAGRLINRTVGDLESIHQFINMSLLWTLDIFIFVTA